MLGWIITFLVLAAIAAILGFGGLASTFAGIAQVLFYILLAVAVVVFIGALITGRKLLH
ncbi:MAG: DUF1328 domain-containing protein [Chitinispirillaceae bacterium]